MLRVLARRCFRTCGTSLCAREIKSGVLFHPISPASQTSPFTFRVLLRNLSFSLSSPQGKNGATQTETNEILETQQLLDSQAQHSLKPQDFSDDSESLKSAEEDNLLAASEIEDNDEDEDEGDVVSEFGEDSPSNATAEFDEDCAIDMSNVPEDLKEMLEDDYEIESAEEYLSSEGTVELLTIDEVKQVLEEVRARDVQIFSVQDRCEWTDVMVVATGISDRHVRGIADALVYKIKKKGNIESSLYPTIEGQVGGKWLVVDCGNIVIHVLNEESRAYYRLEDLWTGDVRPSTTDEDLEKMLRQAGLKDVVP